MQAGSETDSAALKAEALALIQDQRTLVLATCQDNTSWAAPVYFVFHQGCFYFFSSPRSLHIRQSLGHAGSAAAIFADSDQWEKIKGLQMTGRVEPIHPTVRVIQVTTRFVLKFPFAKYFLEGGGHAEPDLKERVKLYGFTPLSAYIVNNQTAFGRRLRLDPGTFEPMETNHG